MSCLLCATYYFNQGFPLPWQTKHTSFKGLSFSDRYYKQKLQDVLLLYTNLIGINVIIIIIIITWLYNNSSTYPLSSERRVLDLESEVQGLNTHGVTFFTEIFCFDVPSDCNVIMITNFVYLWENSIIS